MEHNSFEAFSQYFRLILCDTAGCASVVNSVRRWQAAQCILRQKMQRYRHRSSLGPSGLKEASLRRGWEFLSRVISENRSRLLKIWMWGSGRQGQRAAEIGASGYSQSSCAPLTKEKEICLSRYEPQREKQFPFHRRFRSSKDAVAADSTLNNNHNARHNWPRREPERASASVMSQTRCFHKS
jgi:hypothetical protein